MRTWLSPLQLAWIALIARRSARRCGSSPWTMGQGRVPDDRKTIQITINRSKSDPGQAIVHHDTLVAKALLGAEEGDEVEVLVGNYVRPAVVERIIKAAVGS
jgi:hypothetical protein